MRVLVANEPRAYREVIADALPKLRPSVEVFLAEPEELEREAMWVRPHLILCSRSIGAALARDGRLLVWMVLHPDGEDRAEVGDAFSGYTTLLPEGVALEDLLRVVDETAWSAFAGKPPDRSKQRGEDRSSPLEERSWRRNGLL